MILEIGKSQTDNMKKNRRTVEQKKVRKRTCIKENRNTSERRTGEQKNRRAGIYENKNIG